MIEKTLDTFASRAKSGEFLISVQIDPPANSDIEKFQGSMEELANNGVGLIDINSSRSNAKRPITHDSIALSMALSGYGFETIPHVTLREASLNGLLKQIASAYLWGDVRNFLIISGDAHIESPVAKAPGIFECDVPQVLDAVHKFLRCDGEYNLKDLTLLAAINQNAPNIALEIDRLAMKRAAGADMFMTQTLFDKGQIERFFDLFGKVSAAPLMIGVFPLFNFKTIENVRAGFIPGVVLPRNLFEEACKYKDDKASLRAWGVDQAIAVIKDIVNFKKKADNISGVYIVSPTRNPCLALDIIRGL